MMAGGRSSRLLADQVYLNVRTLCHQLVAGSDPGDLRLWRAAEFSAPLQCGADAARSDRANGRGQALVRADALGICSRLGEGPEDRLAHDQRARRIGQRQAGLPQRHAPPAFAGLWETWTGPNGEEVDTAAIVTTRANRTLAAIHERMPVIVAPEAFALWLDCATVDATTAAALIAPAPEALLECYEVSPAVNRVANDSAALIALAPAAPDRDAQSAAKAPAKPKKPDDQASL